MILSSVRTNVIMEMSPNSKIVCLYPVGYMLEKMKAKIRKLNGKQQDSTANQTEEREPFIDVNLNIYETFSK